ncbi:hypothetical protein FRC02_005905 [Tulasnella sp. 418]|nr:hypothetical protein FRC02_005905 [Tulasnella sp. 418]
MQHIKEQLLPLLLLDHFFKTARFSLLQTTARSGRRLRITCYNASPIFPRPTDANKAAANANSYKSSASQEEDTEQSADDFRRPKYNREDTPLLPVLHPHSYIVQRKLVSTQTGKGQIKSIYMGVVIGNGREANGDGNEVPNRDVDGLQIMFKGEAIWTEMENKFVLSFDRNLVDSEWLKLGYYQLGGMGYPYNPRERSRHHPKYLHHRQELRLHRRPVATCRPASKLKLTRKALTWSRMKFLKVIHDPQDFNLHVSLATTPSSIV